MSTVNGAEARMGASTPLESRERPDAYHWSLKKDKCGEDECFTIENIASGRRIIAEDNKEGIEGVGAERGKTSSGNDKWFVKVAECPGSACVTIENSKNGRLLSLSESRLSADVLPKDTKKNSDALSDYTWQLLSTDKLDCSGKNQFCSDAFGKCYCMGKLTRTLLNLSVR